MATLLRSLVHESLLATMPHAQPLTQRDQQILSRLLADPRMTDCHEALDAMKAAGNKGDFEQESLGRPTLEGWPFYA
jgi:hypothetical protein